MRPNEHGAEWMPWKDLICKLQSIEKWSVYGTYTHILTYQHLFFAWLNSFLHLQMKIADWAISNVIKSREKKERQKKTNQQASRTWIWIQPTNKSQTKKESFTSLMHGICIPLFLSLPLETSVNTLFWCWMKMLRNGQSKHLRQINTHIHMVGLNSGSFGNVLSSIFFKFDRIYSVCCTQQIQLKYLYRCWTMRSAFLCFIEHTCIPFSASPAHSSHLFYSFACIVPIHFVWYFGAFCFDDFPFCGYIQMSRKHVVSTNYFEVFVAPVQKCSINLMQLTCFHSFFFNKY